MKFCFSTPRRKQPLAQYFAKTFLPKVESYRARHLDKDFRAKKVQPEDGVNKCSLKEDGSLLVNGVTIKLCRTLRVPGPVPLLHPAGVAEMSLDNDPLPDHLPDFGTYKLLFV